SHRMPTNFRANRKRSATRMLKDLAVLLRAQVDLLLVLAVLLRAVVAVEAAAVLEGAVAR
ncbi:MAG: hypothetical protein ACRD82_09185, partial [Blastocatellia bacterium]